LKVDVTGVEFASRNLTYGGRIHTHYQLISLTPKQCNCKQFSHPWKLDLTQLLKYDCGQFNFYGHTFYYKNTNDSRSSGLKSLLLDPSHVCR